MNDTPTRAAQGAPDPAGEPIRQLASAVLPLWMRHLETAQQQSEEGISSLLRLFAELRPHLPLTGGTQTAPRPAKGGPSVHELLDSILMSFQYQDRVAQMVRLLQDDMQRLQQAASDPATDPAAFDAQAWLARLESCYAMEEQRQTHNVMLTGDAASSGASDETTYF